MKWNKMHIFLLLLRLEKGMQRVSTFSPFKKMPMGRRLQKLKKIKNVIVSDWKTRYRLVFSNEETHEQRFVIKKITIQKIVVVTIIAVFIIIALTALLISLTPLRVYVPGYTSKKEYRLYRQTAAKLDSLEEMVAVNQQYMDNFIALLNDNVPDSKDMIRDSTAIPNVHYTSRDKDKMLSVKGLEKEAEKILGRIREDKENDNSAVTSFEEAKITNLSLYPPAFGTITRPFNPSVKHYGIDICNVKNSLILNVADGVVIYAGFNVQDGNMIIVQHPGNLISIYKHNETLLKSTGAQVQAGTPIATMGNSGLSENTTVHLHFELWYNGFPFNPLNYFVIE